MLNRSPVRPNLHHHHTFQTSSGSVPGRRHVGSGNLLGGRNNQDAFGLYASTSHSFFLASVHDGCSSGTHSEVGALMAPRLLAASFEKALDQLQGWMPPDPRLLVNIAQFYFLDSLCQIAERLSPLNTAECFNKTVQDFFLFTTLGALLIAESCVVFSCGDGLYWLNEELSILEPDNGNKPSYIAYAMLKDHSGEPAFQPSLSVVALRPVSALQNLVLATDGAQALIRSEHSLVPGKRTTVGPVNQIWQNDRFYDDQQPELLTPWLRQLNSEVTRVGAAEEGRELKRHFGLLEDDTTLVSLRRRRREDYD